MCRKTFILVFHFSNNITQTCYPLFDTIFYNPCSPLIFSPRFRPLLHNHRQLQRYRVVCNMIISFINQTMNWSSTCATYWNQFLSPTMPATPTAYTPKSALQPPSRPHCPCPTLIATRSYTKHPPKIQSVPGASANAPKPTPVKILVRSEGD